jgi:hypothetical protein
MQRYGKGVHFSGSLLWSSGEPFPQQPACPFQGEELLRPFLSGERGGKLRSQLAALHPARWPLATHQTLGIRR